MAPKRQRTTAGKRPVKAARVEEKEEEEPIEERQVDTTDYFSNANNDGLLSVLSLLDREKIDMVMSANSRMHEIAQHFSLHKIKSTVSELTVSNGEDRARGQPSRWTTASSSDNCGLNASGTVVKVQYYYISADVEVGRGRQQKTRTERWTSPTLGISDALYGKLQRALELYNVERIVLLRVHVDQEFLKRVGDMSHLLWGKPIRFMYLTYAEGITAQMMLQFAIRIGTSWLEIADHVFDYSRFIDAKYLADFLAIRKTDECSAIMVENRTLVPPSLSTQVPSNAALLSTLARYDGLELYRLQLTPEQFVQLVLVFLDRSRAKHAEWRFSLTGPVEPAHLAVLGPQKYRVGAVTAQDAKVLSEPGFRWYNATGYSRIVRLDRSAPRGGDVARPRPARTSRAAFRSLWRVQMVNGVETEVVSIHAVLSAFEP